MQNTETTLLLPAPVKFILLPKWTISTRNLIRNRRKLAKDKKIKSKSEQRRKEFVSFCNFAMAVNFNSFVEQESNKSPLLEIMNEILYKSSEITKMVSRKVYLAVGGPELRINLLADTSSGIIEKAVKRYDELIFEHGGEKNLLSKKQYLKERKKCTVFKKNIPEILKKHQEQNGQCIYCKGNLIEMSEAGNPITIDHIVPISKGGKSEYVNMVLCCKACNSKKEDMMPLDFIKL